jgi:5-methyltetrahydrofolate--homocysteine methyltransferase
MNIDFDTSRWERVRETAERWWAGELRRPLLYITRKDRDPGRPEPSLPWKKYAAAYDCTVSAEAIIDRWDYEISRLRFFGDAFPHFWPNFGAGVIAAFLGARLESREETCWFLPDRKQEAGEIEFRFDPENIWYRRVSDLCLAAMDRWEGSVQVAMTDLGGNLDIISTFRSGKQLLLDLYDHPEDIKWLIWKAHELWWNYFDAFNTILRPVNPGYTSWTPIFSDVPFYMLQCDFSYMIGPGMFGEFVKPELAASCRRLDHPFYHLDGPGQLVHLDSILSIPELKGVQWIPGEGSPVITRWPEVFRKIRDSGKLIQFFGDIGDLDGIIEQLGGPEGIMLVSWETGASESEIEAALDKYGAG